MFFKKKKKQNTNYIKSSDKIIIKQLETDEDSVILDLADKLIDGAPLILNFDLLNVDAANKVIAFFSGVVYTLKGNIETINETVFLFANEEAFLDGSLKRFLENL
ncbi:predicted cell division protein SepF [Alteracholeplasma palmae J233]|uniref:Predicted cell division protein SepF n=1 Tax=Alteracholeplasma palmae (strain ATCC 49389 / J233) TaxID=1318466 RepID=U4KQ89_ALTPJ|nr:cell division protein SepF [Alteracholeplasma palmae]CCV64445.1 predicted cell division protein SepF [Alteracholeplasma palmae J233]